MGLTCIIACPEMLMVVQRISIIFLTFARGWAWSVSGNCISNKRNMFIKNCVVLTCWPIRAHSSIFIQGEYHLLFPRCGVYIFEMFEILKPPLAWITSTLNTFMVFAFPNQFSLLRFKALKVLPEKHSLVSNPNRVFCTYILKINKKPHEIHTRISRLNQKFTFFDINFANCWKHRYLRCLSQAI